MEAIYFIDEGNLRRRLDSAMIEPMHLAGFPIIKVWLDNKLTEERLEPNEEIPDGFIQESRYGYVVYNQQEGE